jgi:hypothetical protein
MANGNITIYVGQKLEAQIREYAAGQRRSLSQQVTLILEDFFNGTAKTTERLDQITSDVADIKSRLAKGE